MANGFIVLDKPTGIGSNKALGKIKRLFNQKKAGFIGTLDPLASGILPVALGEATKLIHLLEGGTKIYEFTVQFGQATDTDDSQGKIIATSPTLPNLDNLQNLLTKFTGVITQTPPQYSAIKINGKKAYDIARQGKQADIKQRQVNIFNIKLLNYAPPYGSFICECSKGTYIRSIARDMGQLLNTYGHITVLRRIKSGIFNTSNKITLDELEKTMYKPAPNALNSVLVPMENVLDDIPDIQIGKHEADKIRMGQFLSTDMDDVSSLALLCNNKLIALAKCQNGLIKPTKVINNNN